ncbi:SubName: Full=Uncharacterized protein {ECO:0000313/EMBL:CCA73584.1} [Serendipita indica DSM 11827]|nr:SubName: Full=Uncharacterized protein {ECO:0000313/EMBL:CCA73584.1} [Serendipita indica DSM 11827]
MPFLVHAHDHHDNGGANADGELDALIIVHIALQFVVWCIMFPIGLIFGFTRARWHVPLQATGFVLTIGGYILGHTHGGRTFPASLHGKLASYIEIAIASQILLGTYLKLHIHEGTAFRKWMVLAHRIVGLSYPAFGWTQALFGVLVLGGVCPLDDKATRATVLTCAEPFITGSALIQYGFYAFLLSLAVPRWRDQSPETWDSLILCISGIMCGVFNFWRLGAIWIGFIWCIGGIISFVLSRNGRRTTVPAIVVIITGLVQMLQPKEKGAFIIFFSFGAILTVAGLVRMLEVYAIGIIDKGIISAIFISSGIVYISSSNDLRVAWGIVELYPLFYFIFIGGVTMGLGTCLAFLGHLYRTTGRNAHKAGYAPTPYHPLDRHDHQRQEGRSEPIDESVKFVVAESDDEDEAILGQGHARAVDAYQLGVALRDIDDDDDDEIRK